MNTQDFNTLNYTSFSVDAGKLPPVSLHRLASYGLAHYLGNQAASKVVAWAEKDENKNATDEQKAAQKVLFQNAMVQALLDGTIGQHAARGPAVDPVEAEMDRIAKAEVVQTLKANNIKVPKGEDKVKFANGNEFTMDELIARRVEKYTDRLTTEAKASLKAKEAAKKKAAAKVAGVGAEDL